MIKAACNPKNLATVSTAFLPVPAVRKSSSTITRFATTTAPSTTWAVSAGGVRVRVMVALPAVIGTPAPAAGGHRAAFSGGYTTTTAARFTAARSSTVAG